MSSSAGTETTDPQREAILKAAADAAYTARPRGSCDCSDCVGGVAKAVVAAVEPLIRAKIVGQLERDREYAIDAQQAGYALGLDRAIRVARGES